MARLVVEATSGEWRRGPDIIGRLLVDVSVSRANDGSPVTGLGTGNFRLAAQSGVVVDFAIAQVDEWRWEPDDVEHAGCYLLRIGDAFTPGEQYTFGIQARTFDNHHPPRVVDQGQTIVRVISRGA
jgi:hypothetical protein